MTDPADAIKLRISRALGYTTPQATSTLVRECQRLRQVVEDTRASLKQLQVSLWPIGEHQHGPGGELIGIRPHPGGPLQGPTSHEVQRDLASGKHHICAGAGCLICAEHPTQAERIQDGELESEDAELLQCAADARQDVEEDS